MWSIWQAIVNTGKGSGGTSQWLALVFALGSYIIVAIGCSWKQRAFAEMVIGTILVGSFDVAVNPSTNMIYGSTQSAWIIMHSISYMKECSRTK